MWDVMVPIYIISSSSFRCISVEVFRIVPESGLVVLKCDLCVRVRPWKGFYQSRAAGTVTVFYVDSLPTTVAMSM